MRPVLPLHARQAARHCDCCFVVRHLQKAWHGSLRPAQAVPTPSGLSTAPAKTAPSRRSDSRRGTDSASDLENSSNRLSMIDSSLLAGRRMVMVTDTSETRSVPSGDQSHFPFAQAYSFPGSNDSASSPESRTGSSARARMGPTPTATSLARIPCSSIR